ncbi:hypothetical protein PISMIDRAFT_563122 [Pisolithus microcarpus 441]|uniref:Uncharacterized protein n=1 Tax=Pisolithus microcarpus 441 TaxID=765257 RepID=A0A0C9Y928_9AGAM|nr:hypothetical protein PISMIDRAFT_563122 [Pisolithus microcarpus 441]
MIGQGTKLVYCTLMIDVRQCLHYQPWQRPTTKGPTWVPLRSRTRLSVQELRTRGYEKLYRARVGLGRVEFMTADDLPLSGPQQLVLVHSWIRRFRGPRNGVAWRDDSRSDSDPNRICHPHHWTLSPPLRLMTMSRTTV